ncbi:MAG: M23 family metallopeptidase [Candidatus Nealsonbacteria bacterium]|nr:M23 family metallopeptidase [Candidatus Nealsonbacteria bacterium]
MRTENKYAYPIVVSDKIKILYDESPAHTGNLKYSVDFICEQGTKVIAAADGRVIDLKLDSEIGGENKELDSLGNFIEIEHDNQEFSEYEHLKKDGVLVKLGDKVKKGQVIGYSGATGWLAHLGPHLHFMVGKYGKTDEDYETLEIVWE